MSKSRADILFEELQHQSDSAHKDVNRNKVRVTATEIETGPPVSERYKPKPAKKKRKFPSIYDFHPNLYEVYSDELERHIQKQKRDKRLLIIWWPVIAVVAYFVGKYI